MKLGLDLISRELHTRWPGRCVLDCHSLHLTELRMLFGSLPRVCRKGAQEKKSNPHRCWNIRVHLPPPGLQQFFRVELGHVEAAHGLAQVLAALGDDGGLVVVRGGADDSFGALRRILRLEDP